MDAGLPLDPLHNYALKRPVPPQEEFGTRVAVMCEELLFKMKIKDQQHEFNVRDVHATTGSVGVVSESSRISSKAQTLQGACSLDSVLACPAASLQMNATIGGGVSPWPLAARLRHAFGCRRSHFLRHSSCTT